MNPPIAIAARHMDSLAPATIRVLGQRGRHGQQIVRFTREKAALAESTEPLAVSLIADYQVGVRGIECASCQRNQRGRMLRRGDGDGRIHL